MKTEVSTRLFNKLRSEVHGERRHGHIEMLPNVYFFKRTAEELFQELYLSVPKESINLLNDVERSVMFQINYIISKKINGYELSSNLIEVLTRIEGALELVKKESMLNRSIQ